MNVTDESCNFVVEDCLALNCNPSSLLVFPNERNAQRELKNRFFIRPQRSFVM